MIDYVNTFNTRTFETYSYSKIDPTIFQKFNMELIFDIIEWHEVNFETSPPLAVYIKAANANVFLLDVLARKIFQM